jgi:hypothetical protein
MNFPFKLQDSQKPFIAQAISRVYRKKLIFTEAEYWATKAIGIKDSHLFYDTRGQAHKAKLKELQENEGGLQRFIDCLETGRKAVKDFQAAENCLKESKTTEQAKQKQNIDLG